jgi:8-amino-7-oxononanoate synthase
VVELGFTDKVWARVITFGKAIGCHGAAVLGGDLLRDFLVNFSRPFIYTTGLPEDAVQRIGKSYEYLLETNQIEVLQNRIEQFRDGLNLNVKSKLIASRSAIQSLLMPGNDEVKALASELQAAGFDIRPILHPTVPKGSERLRICLHSFNEATDIDRLVQFLNHAFYNK